MPPELQTFFLAMTPLGELRAAIPVALTVLKLSVVKAWFWAVLGNMVPPLILLLFLDPFSLFLAKYSKMFSRGLDWWLAHAQKKFQNHYLKWGMLALVLFVAIPLPVTGAWTGAAAAYLFGIPKIPAFFLILLGVMIAGIIVTGVTMGIFSML